MNQIPTVSVVIPNYNYGRFIAEAIESVLAQTHPIQEIIVVDDGSTDDSIEIIKRFSAKVKLISQQNRGVGAARNVGVKSSNGEFIAFLDADDIWLPTKIEEQLKGFTDKVVLVSCGKREFDSQNGKTLVVRLPDRIEWSAEDILLRRYSLVLGCSALMTRRKTFEEIGDFDEQLAIAEDWDFCYRAAKHGKVTCVPKVLVDYRSHGGNVHLKTLKLERFTLLAYENIFREADEKTLRLQSRCYGNLHKILAGAFFQSGDYRAFINHTIKALWYEPRQLAYYLKFPARYLKRRI